MAGRPKRRARIAAQWAEVDRAAGRTPNAGRAKTRTYEVVVGDLGTLYKGTDRIQAEIRFGNLARASDAHDALALIAGLDVRLYCDGVLLAEHIGYLHSRTANAGRPKRRARIAAQWAEVDRAAGVKVPRAKRKKNGGLPSHWFLFESMIGDYTHYTLICSVKDPVGGVHVYAHFRENRPDGWDTISASQFQRDAREGFAWWGVRVKLDEVPEPYRSRILKKAAEYDRLAAGGARESSSAYASREERLAAMPSYRKR